MKSFLLFITTAFLFIGIFFVLWGDINAGTSKDTRDIKKGTYSYTGTNGLTMRQIDSVSAAYNFNFTRFNNPTYTAQLNENKES